MLNNLSRTWLVGGVWFTTVAAIVVSSVAIGARTSTSALLLLVGALPLGVALLIGFGAPPPTVAELLHTVDSQPEGRS
jgi:hypothetical protein